MIRRLGRTSRLAVLVPALLLVFSGAALAQKTAGEVRGTVYDTTGAVVPSASVLVTNQDTGQKAERATDAKGDFLIPFLQPGNYKVQVTAPNFKKYTQQDIAVRALDTVSVSVKLEVGPVGEEVIVMAETDQVNVASGGVAQRLSKEMLSEFPNINRYGFANASLLPTVSQANERPETINSSVGGNDLARNSFYIDGAEATDTWRGWSPRQPVVDAIEEVVVTTAGATPDVGANFGGVYNAILKSGTNTFHGGAWYYLRSKSLNANGWGNNNSNLERQDDNLKYYGANFGGPVIKDKLFFFVTGHRETDAVAYTSGNHRGPTAAMVSGNFAGLTARDGSPVTIYNPDTGVAFADNQIPANMIDPVAKKFWDENGFTNASYTELKNFPFTMPRKVKNLNVRLDYNVNDKHRLTASGYYMRNLTTAMDRRTVSISGWSANTLGVGKMGNELSNFPQSVFNLKHTWMVKPNVFVETHGAYMYMPEYCVMDADASAVNFKTLGVQNDPAPRPGAPEMLPTLLIGPWWGDQEGQVIFNGWTTNFQSRNLTLGSNVTWVQKSHSVKVGVEFQRGRFNDLKPAKPSTGNDGIEFPGNISSDPNNRKWNSDLAYSFADFLMGRFRYYQVGDQNRMELKSTNIATYIMDTWRVSPRLTVTPGLRVDINSGMKETDNHLTMYRPGVQSTLMPTAPNGLVTAGDAGIPDTLVDLGPAIAPRINAAYDLTGDGKTALRGSFGLYFGRDVFAVYQGNSDSFAGAAPFKGTNVYSYGGKLSNPWLTGTNASGAPYTAPPLPFVDQDPRNYQWPTTIGDNIMGISSDYQLARSTQWNIAVERELVKGVRLELGYQGNSSTNQPTRNPTNMAQWQAGATQGNADSRRPNKLFQYEAFRIDNIGISKYDAVVASLRMRNSNMNAQINYAYTHARRNFGGSGSTVNRAWDQPLTFAGYPDMLMDGINNHNIGGWFVWQVPLLKNNKTVAGRILGGWSLTADGSLTFFRKGGTVFLGYDANADDGNSRAYSNDVAKVSGSLTYPKTPINQGNVLMQWLDPAPFQYPNGGKAGQTEVYSSTVSFDGVNVAKMPGSWFANMSLFKNFVLTGSAKLQLRFEVYNVFNHANINDPTLSTKSADFGKILGKYGTGRRVQLGARLTF